MIKSIVLGGVALAALAVAPAFAQSTALKVNEIAEVQGVKTACGGASLDDQQAMGTQNFPVTLKLVGGYGQWLGEENLTITGGGQTISLPAKALGCRCSWRPAATRPRPKCRAARPRR